MQVVAQTLSSSVADALEFLIRCGHTLFIDAAGTIKFIRAIDKVFYILNSRTPFGKGYNNLFALPTKVITRIV